MAIFAFVAVALGGVPSGYAAAQEQAQGAGGMAATVRLGKTIQGHVDFHAPDGSGLAGNVTFFVCGPDELDLLFACTLGGRPAGGAATDASGMASSPAFAPDAVGRWCFRGESNQRGIGGLSAPRAAGCFLVTQGVPQVLAGPSERSASAGAPLAAVVAVEGVKPGPIPTGVVAFFACRAGTAAAPRDACEGPDEILGSATLDAQGRATSAPFTPKEPGRWCFRASYLGDASYFAIEAAALGRCSIVGPAPPPG